MEIIDTHIHAETRHNNDIKKMNTYGIKKAISCSYCPHPIENQNTLIDLFKRLEEFDKKRYNEEGVKLYLSYGIHPNNALEENEKILEKIEKSIEKGKIKAIGEIGLETGNTLEKNTLKKQLEIAENTKTPVIIHTPKKDKLEKIKIIEKIIEETTNPKLVLIDHNTEETVEYLKDKPYTLGISIQDTYMIKKEEAIEILKTYGFNKFTLNSDVSIFNSEAITVPETIRELEKLEYNKKEIEKVAYKNAEKFFKL